jgi:hypothetical protein
MAVIRVGFLRQGMKGRVNVDPEDIESVANIGRRRSPGP